MFELLMVLQQVGSEFFNLSISEELMEGRIQSQERTSDMTDTQCTLPK